MLITQTEAVRRLVSAHGMGPGRAREALISGLAGPETRVGQARLFASEAVAELEMRKTWTSADARRAMPEGVIVVRVNPQRALNIADDWADQVATVGSGWRLGQIPRIVVHAKVRRKGIYPFIATVSGFPAVCANATAISTERVRGEIRCSFALKSPGAWTLAFDKVRLALGSGHEAVVLDPSVADGIFSRANQRSA
ncbi:hypothetical protein [Nocardioides sp. Kera G14]|uniref:hypothetical protein n=1 Tax=Nocardioides sp. Kera G14 TaxID=2884264 RepID=UPI001D1296AC|nr:hypothetical protein [Nocardioides sp. Kera G14]UDY23135.1 hypothetical protein LH076_13850 [Nocardioides sp. Kera G14]